MDVLNPRDIPIEDLAADYKYRGLKPFLAWDQLIIDRNLCPGINAKDFYNIFERVIAYPLLKNESFEDFKPTHMDTMLNHKCEMITKEDGVINVRWDNGHTGGYPPCYPPEEGRYVKLEEES